METLIFVAVAALVLVVGIALLFVLGFSLIVALVVFFVVALIGGAWFFLFGGSSMLSSIPLLGLLAAFFSDYSEATHIPDAFVACMYSEPVDECRANYTTWQDDKNDFLENLKEQMGRELGVRLSSSQARINVTTDSQGKVILLERQAVYEKQTPTVRESFSLVEGSDGFLIKDFSINY